MRERGANHSAHTATVVTIAILTNGKDPVTVSSRTGDQVFLCNFLMSVMLIIIHSWKYTLHTLMITTVVNLYQKAFLTNSKEK